MTVSGSRMALVAMVMCVALMALVPSVSAATGTSCPVRADLPDNCMQDIDDDCKVKCLYITSNVLSGLLVFGLLLLLSYVGFGMLSSIQTPKRFEGEADADRKQR